MKFLIDMPVTPEAVPRLQTAGHDAVHAVAVGLAHASDSQVLEVARREGRIVIIADLDYPRLLALQAADGPGLILFGGGSYSDMEMLDLLRMSRTGPLVRALPVAPGFPRRAARPAAPPAGAMAPPAARQEAHLPRAIG